MRPVDARTRMVGLYRWWEAAVMLVGFALMLGGLDYVVHHRRSPVPGAVIVMVGALVAVGVGLLQLRTIKERQAELRRRHREKNPGGQPPSRGQVAAKMGPVIAVAAAVCAVLVWRGWYVFAFVPGVLALTWAGLLVWFTVNYPALTRARQERAAAEPD